MAVTRELIHDAVDEYLDWCKYGEKIPIEEGRISIELLISKGKIDMTVGDRMRRKEVEFKR